MLGEWLSHASRYGEHAIGLMVRRSRTELLETIERSKQIYGPLNWKFNEVEHLWRGPDGSRLRFAYLERDADADRYQGHSYTRLYVEEIGNFPSPAPILKLMATLRSGAGVPVGMRATGNPGGCGHHWVKARYIDPAPHGNEIIRDPLTHLERVFIPSRVDNNRHIDIAAYKQRLRGSGPPELVRAWLDGDWSVTLGAFFDCWSDKRHVVDPFPIPKEWMRFRSMDWGSASPFSVGWWAVVQDDYPLMGELGTRILPRGCMVRYREWYGMKQGQPNVGIKLHAGIVGDCISLKEKDEPISYGVLDPSAFAEDGGPSIAERISAGSQGKVWFRRADNTRVSARGAMGGWDQMRARLVGDKEGRPLIVTFATCIDSIRTIPFLQHDPDRLEDLQSDSEDHCFAAGTLVETDRGPMPIEQLVGTTGRVLSLNGTYEPYRSVRLTRRNAALVRVTFQDGRTILCTKDHRFLTLREKWCYASALKGRSTLCVQPSSVTRFKNSAASTTISAAGTFNTKVGGFMSLFGNIIADQFRQVITSTTKITIAPIMTLAILSVSRGVNTWEDDTAKRVADADVKQYTRPSQPLQHGMPPRKEGNGIPSISNNTFNRSWRSAFLRSARNAARAIWSVLFAPLKANSAGQPAGRARCVNVEEAGSGNVFCLTVPTTGCFAIEGGLLVSNCADEWRYACMSRPYVPTIEQQKPEDISGYKRFRDTAKPGDWIAY
jgi:hypothetical protein